MSSGSIDLGGFVGGVGIFSIGDLLINVFKGGCSWGGWWVECYD